MFFRYVIYILFFYAPILMAGEIRVAVASNFLSTMKDIQALYESESGDQLIISAGSTGKLYAQIYHGAPYDVFLSADERRPNQLITDGHAVSGSQIPYALGRLSLWSAQKKNTGANCKEILESGNHGRVATANPKTAPYGTATSEVLEQMGLIKQLKGNMARGENIGQTFQYVRTGNAELGFVAQSQLATLKHIPGCYWHIPAHFHAPIVQNAVLLKRARDADSANRFLAFLRSKQARSLILSAGYGLPAQNAIK